MQALLTLLWRAGPGVPAWSVLVLVMTYSHRAHANTVHVAVMTRTRYCVHAQVNMRRYNTVCGPGQCEWQEAAIGRAQNWELQKRPDPQLVEVIGFASHCIARAIGVRCCCV